MGTGDFMSQLNPNSIQVLKDVKCEESLAKVEAFDRFQFERNAYFVVDYKYSKPGKPVFNRIVGLKESAGKPRLGPASGGPSRKEQQAKQAAEKDAKKKLDPKDMFRSQTDLYSKFDEEGVPTHGADGEPLPKKRVKKLKGEWDTQKKLFESK